MSKTFKAKFYVQNVQSFTDPQGKKLCEKVTLAPIQSSDPNSPNYSFSQYTPSGGIEMTITNPDLWGNVVGTYLIDFTPAE
ncbi:hypothetical protein EON83_12495 [bacterium]|nr:MAG: hypothetical protein EON83_12495 [bacterium]